MPNLHPERESRNGTGSAGKERGSLAEEWIVSEVLRVARGIAILS